MLIENLEREIKWYKQPEAEGKTLQKVAWHRELLRKQKKLTSVARASLEELLLDYEDCLRQHNLALWPQNRPEIQAIKKSFVYPTSHTCPIDPILPEQNQLQTCSLATYTKLITY